MSNFDTIAWAKKGNKIVYGNVLDTVSDSAVNIRWHKGDTIFGIEVVKDTLDLEGMKAQLVEGGGIREPLLISVRSDGMKVRLRGNRRGLAAEELCRDPLTPAELVKSLKEQTPMILVHGLSLDDERTLVNDQSQKPFLRSEVIRNVLTLWKQGWTFERIAMYNWEDFGKGAKDLSKLAEIREITNPVTKKEKVKQWLRGSLDMYLLHGFALGAWMQKQILLSEMKREGSLPENAEQPYFYTTKGDSQKRVKALENAKKQDGDKHNPLMLVDGTEFKKIADAFHAEDYGLLPETAPKVGATKLPSRKEIEAMRDALQSKCGRNAISRVLGENVPELSARDDYAVIMETKAEIVAELSALLSPEVREVIDAVFKMTDPVNFRDYLVTKCLPAGHDESPWTVSERDAFRSE